MNESSKLTDENAKNILRVEQKKIYCMRIPVAKRNRRRAPHCSSRVSRPFNSSFLSFIRVLIIISSSLHMILSLIVYLNTDECNFSIFLARQGWIYLSIYLSLMRGFKRTF